MIFIQALRKNDINPNSGKQFEFGKSMVNHYGWDSSETHEVTITYRGKTVPVCIKVRGNERGGDRAGIDAKEYKNSDGVLALKGLLRDEIGLNESHIGIVHLIFDDPDNQGTHFNLYTTPPNLNKDVDKLDTPESRKEAFRKYIYNKTSASAAPQYVNGLERDIVIDAVKEVTNNKYESIYCITTVDDAFKVRKLVMANPRNNDRTVQNYAGYPGSACLHYIDFVKDVLSESFFDSNNSASNSAFESEPLQQIFYGAPGTGKSHTINKITAGQKVIRTTFHPDSDYATFVGAYKPVMRELPIRTVIGTKSVNVTDENDQPLTEKKIEYDFVPQAFTEAYIEAWKDLSKPVFLVIEEINRGNCAQIFGDIFQLLDRGENKFSSYTVSPNEDLKRYIEGVFASVEFDPDSELDNSLTFDIWEGKKLCLPRNLYIWATMNTSDQSLFPIDSAFKRRWDWKYVPIDTRKEDWTILANGNKYVWGSFLEKINEEIGETTSSEDKKLGFYFCKAKDGEISAERFVSKVLFYVYNDVFKDYGFEREFFKNENGKTMAFQSFYNVDGSVNEAQVENILKKLNVEKSIEENIINPDIDRDQEAREPTELKTNQLNFWKGFNDYLENKPNYTSIYNLRKATDNNWMDLAFGTSKYWPTLRAKFSINKISAGIWIGDSTDKDLIYEQFLSNKTQINELVGEEMTFKSNGKTYSILLNKIFDLNTDKTKWPEAYEWLMTIALKMKEVKDKFGI